MIQRFAAGWLTVTLSIYSLLSASPVLADDGGSRYTGERFASRSPVLARNGMAATSHPLASAIAIDVLKRGGSAVDAAIAANAMLGLVEPYACGIGGDLFAIVWDPKSNTLYGYNGSGRTPQKFGYDAMRQELGDNGKIPLFGPLAVTVPGAVDGWFALHKRFGRLPLSDVLQPAIRYAREGVAITEVDAALWTEAFAEFAASDLPASMLAEMKKTYTIEGKPPRSGDVFRNPQLADSYQKLITGGRKSFYEGDVAHRIATSIAKQGGHLTAADLAEHKGEWVTPVSVNYRGYDVFELPPNGQGIAALQMLNILEGFQLAKLGRNSADFWHLMVEAKKLAYEDRAHLYADPTFFNAPVAGLLSKEYAGKRRELIDINKAAQQVELGAPPLHGDTTYLTVADKDGMMVSLIQSNYWEFGSGLIAEGLGFALQNRGSAFAMQEGHANVYAPGKRPFHTIIPAMVMQGGKPIMSFGVMGGFLQPQGHVQILVNIIDLGMNIQEAGDAARFVHSAASQPTGGTMQDGGELLLEAGVAADVVTALRQKGHHVNYGTRPYIGSVGGYQAIWRDPVTGVYQGASEMRFDGAALGY
jgi:gamma-glutamyltranspeptidase/glutathione hydrolase